MAITISSHKRMLGAERMVRKSSYRRESIESTRRERGSWWKALHNEDAEQDLVLCGVEAAYTIAPNLIWA